MRKKNLFVLLVSGLYLLLSIHKGFSAEQLTITTYYPSPYGSYQDLEVTNSLRVGNNTTTSADMAIDAINILPPANNVNKYAVFGRTWDSQVRGALGRTWRDGSNQLWKIAVYGYEPNPNAGIDYAGYFDGDVKITGTLTAPISSSTCVRYDNNGLTLCPESYYVVACGAGSCANQDDVKKKQKFSLPRFFF